MPRYLGERQKIATDKQRTKISNVTKTEKDDLKIFEEKTIRLKLFKFKEFFMIGTFSENYSIKKNESRGDFLLQLEIRKLRSIFEK